MVRCILFVFYYLFSLFLNIIFIMSAETSKEVKFVFVTIQFTNTYRIRRHQSFVLGKRYYQVIDLAAQRIHLITAEGNIYLSF